MAAFPGTKKTRWLPVAGVALAWFFLAALTYHDTNCTFLRGESGWYQVVVHSEDLGRVAAVRDFFLHSHNGHYMPFAVLAEMEMTRLLGLHSDAWKWRAIVTIAILGTVLSAVIYRVGLRAGAHQAYAIACSFVLTSLIVLHPLLREFVAFPTLIYQLSWMLFFVITLGSLLEAAAHPEQARWVWLAAICALASMHTIGLGAITAAATAAVLALVVVANRFGKLPEFSLRRRHWLGALLLLVVMSCLHLAAMRLLHAASDTPSTGQPLSATGILSFTISILVRVPESFLMASKTSYFSAPDFHSHWPFGLAAIAIGSALWIAMLQKTLRSTEPDCVRQGVLHSFTFFAFAAFLGLVAARLPFETDPTWFQPYLTNPRYIVPATLILLPGSVPITLSLFRHRNRALLLCSFLFVAAAFAANQTYNREIYQSLPTARLVHLKTWNRITAMARECRSAGLPVPDVPTRVLGEFPWHLHDYGPLLSASLRLRTGDKIEYAEWSSFDRERLLAYISAAPSLPLVLHDLKLQAEDNR